MKKIKENTNFIASILTILGIGGIGGIIVWVFSLTSHENKIQIEEPPPIIEDDSNGDKDITIENRNGNDAEHEKYAHASITTFEQLKNTTDSSTNGRTDINRYIEDKFGNEYTHSFSLSSGSVSLLLRWRIFEFYRNNSISERQKI